MWVAARGILGRSWAARSRAGAARRTRPPESTLCDEPPSVGCCGCLAPLVGLRCLGLVCLGVRRTALQTRGRARQASHASGPRPWWGVMAMSYSDCVLPMVWLCSLNYRGYLLLDCSRQSARVRLGKTHVSNVVWRWGGGSLDTAWLRSALTCAFHLLRGRSVSNVLRCLRAGLISWRVAEIGGVVYASATNLMCCTISPCVVVLCGWVRDAIPHEFGIEARRPPTHTHPS